MTTIKHETIDGITDNFSRHLSTFTKAVSLYEESKREDVTLCASMGAPNGLCGKKLTHSTIQHLEKLLLSEVTKLGTKTNNLIDRVNESTAKTGRVIPDSGRLSGLNCPVLITDYLKEFFSQVSLGNAHACDVESEEERKLDGNDEKKIKSFYKEKGLKVPHDIKSYSLNDSLDLLFSANVSTQKTLGYLFKIHAHANNLYTPKRRIKLSKEFMDNILDKKMEYVVNGKNILDDYDLDSHTDEINKLIVEIADAEKKMLESKKQLNKWLKLDVSKPSEKKVKKYEFWKNNTNMDLRRVYTDDTNAYKKKVSELSELYNKIFRTNVDSKDPVKLTKNLEYRHTTFREMLMSYKEKKSGKPLILEEDAVGDEWGYIDYLMPAIKARCAVPFDLTKIIDVKDADGNDCKYSKIVRNENVIEQMRSTEKLMKQLIDAHSGKESQEE